MCSVSCYPFIGLLICLAFEMVLRTFFSWNHTLEFPFRTGLLAIAFPSVSPSLSKCFHFSFILLLMDTSRLTGVFSQVFVGII